MPKAPEPSSTCQKTTKSLPRISPKSYCYNAVPNRFLAHLSTSRTNGPRSLSRVKAGTHSPLLKGSHTTARTPKQGPSGRGRYHYPRSVPHIHKHPRAGCQSGELCRFGILAGRCSRRTQKAFGTAMRLCVSLSRRRRGPAGLRNPFFVSVEIAVCTSCAQGLSTRAKEGVVSLPSACSVCCRNAGRPLVRAANLPFSEVG